jgi:hypothetical protein
MKADIIKPAKLDVHICKFAKESVAAILDASKSKSSAP